MHETKSGGGKRRGGDKKWRRGCGTMDAKKIRETKAGIALICKRV